MQGGSDDVVHDEVLLEGDNAGTAADRRRETALESLPLSSPPEPDTDAELGERPRSSLTISESDSDRDADEGVPSSDGLDGDDADAGREQGEGGEIESIGNVLGDLGSSKSRGGELGRALERADDSDIALSAGSGSDSN